MTIMGLPIIKVAYIGLLTAGYVTVIFGAMMVLGLIGDLLVQWLERTIRRFVRMK